MTDPNRGRKVVRVRRLVDPLGALGHRDPRPRLEREGRARRALFAGAFAAFAGYLGLVAAAPRSPAAPPAAADPSLPAAGGRVVAERLIPGRNGEPDTLVRLVLAETAPAPPLLRTQATP